MDDEELFRLEKAARAVLSPPNEITAEQRSEAETVFLQLRKLPRPYQLCRNILESRCSDYVYFQAVCTLKESVLREWPVLSSEEKTDLRQYILQYLIQNTSIPQYVREHLMVFIVLTVKRGILDSNGQQVLDVFIEEVSHILIDQSHKEIGCTLLKTLLTEFSNSTGSSAIGMSLEFHLRCKKAIEQNGGLLKIFTITIQILRHCIQEQEPSHNRQISSLLSLALQILLWDFRSSHLYRLSTLMTSSAVLPFKPSQDFSTIILNPTVLQLFLKIFQQSVNSPEMVCTAGQCLSQLASLSGPVFSSEEEKISYVVTYTQGLLSVLTECSINNQVVYNLSSTFHQLVSAFPRDCFICLGNDLLSAFVQSIVHLVQFCCQISSKEEVGEDVSIIEESLCFLLEVIVRLLEGPNDALKTFLLEPSTNIFTVYLQSKLMAPRGLREHQDTSEVIFDVDEDDREMYSDELSYIGAISRNIPGHSLPLLVSLLHQCIIECIDIYKLFTNDQTSIAVHINKLEGLYEDIHWLLLVSTYTLSDVVSSEESTIPKEILEYSISQQQSYSTCNNLCDFILADDDYASEKTNLSNIDPIVSLVICVCRLCMVEKTFIEGGLKDVVSPQTSETAVWCLTNILSPYLMMDEKMYDQLSISLLDWFGSDTENAKWLLVFILDKVIFNTSVWYAEEKLTIYTLKMLSELASNKMRALYFISCEQLWYFMHAFANGNHPFDVIIPSAQKQVVAGLLGCAVGGKRDRYLSELLEPVRSRFNSIVFAENFQAHHQDETLRNNLTSLLEALSGIALATKSSMTDEIFSFLIPLLYTCVKLFEIFMDSQKISVCILQLFTNVSEIFTIFLEDADAMKLYDVSMSLIITYSKWHTDKYRHGLLSDDDQCDDLILFIQMLSHLTTKDYLDFRSSGSQTVQPVEVVLKGLSIILPIIDEEMLKFPQLCKHFYQLLHYICEIFPESLVKLPDNEIHHVSKLLDLGCARYGPEICVLCVESIESISSCSECNKSPVMLSSFQHFLMHLFQHIMSVDFDFSMLSTYSGALYQLICSLKVYHKELLQALYSACIDATEQLHLQSTIHQLVSFPLLDRTRVNKELFQKNLKDLLPTLRGYLSIK